MTRRVLLALLFLLLPALAICAPPGRLDANQAQQELRLLERALDALHPGLYRYQSPEQLAAEFASARESAAAADGIEPERMYLLATRLAASVRCGHTWTNPLNQSDTLKARLAMLPVLPVRVRLLDRRLLVVASSDPAIARFDEILAIDGRSVPSLIDAFMPYLRADGSSDGKRLAQWDSDAGGVALDQLLPLLFPPTDDHYQVALRRPDGQRETIRVQAVPRARRDGEAAGSGDDEPAWSLVFHGETAVLTVPTFAFWRGEFDWRTFLRETFETLRRRGTPRLVLDLRLNEGGDSQIGRELLGYLIQTPYEAPAGRVRSRYERAPYRLARYLDTWDFDFLDRTGTVEPDGDGYWRFLEPPRPQRAEPLAPRFTGEVYALTGPRMSSAGFLIARDLQATGAAILVGEPTGGNRRGLNGGQLAWLTLPYSGVAVDIPLVATLYDGAPDAPVFPDVARVSTVEDVIAGRDPALEFALGHSDDGRPASK